MFAEEKKNFFIIVLRAGFFPSHSPVPGLGARLRRFRELSSGSARWLWSSIALMHRRGNRLTYLWDGFRRLARGKRWMFRNARELFRDVLRREHEIHESCCNRAVRHRIVFGCCQRQSYSECRNAMRCDFEARGVRPRDCFQTFKWNLRQTLHAKTHTKMAGREHHRTCDSNAPLLQLRSGAGVPACEPANQWHSRAMTLVCQLAGNDACPTTSPLR